jgi:hypothetical protein
MSSSIRSRSDTVKANNVASLIPNNLSENFRTRSITEGYSGVTSSIRGTPSSFTQRVENLGGSALTNSIAPQYDSLGRFSPFRNPNIAGNSVNFVPPGPPGATSGLANYSNNLANNSTEGFKIPSNMGQMGSFSRKEQYVAKDTTGSGHMTLEQQRKQMGSKEMFGPASGTSKTGNLTLREQRELITR